MVNGLESCAVWCLLCERVLSPCWDIAVYPGLASVSGAANEGVGWWNGIRVGFSFALRGGLGPVSVRVLLPVNCDNKASAASLAL